MRALKTSGLRYDRALVFNAFSYDTPARTAYRSILDPATQITAVLCASHGLARILAEAAQVAGHKVPADLSLACWDSRQDPAFSGPGIDFEALGRRAALLLREGLDKPRVIRVSAPWQDGGTAGPCFC